MYLCYTALFHIQNDLSFLFYHEGFLKDLAPPSHIVLLYDLSKIPIM